MKICKNCNIELADDAKNCLLCGAKVVENNDKSVQIQGIYNSKIYDRSPNIVKHIFIGVLALIGVVGLILSIIMRSFAPVAYTAVGVSFVWFSILSHIFYKHHTKYILNASLFYIDVYTISLLMYFGHTDLAFKMVLPLSLALMISAQAMIVFIGGKYREYSVSLFVLSLIAIVTMIALLVKFSLVSSIVGLVAGLLGVVTILGSLVFKRNDLALQLKKIFHI